MDWFSKKQAFKAPAYALRTVPGPGAGNAAYEPGMSTLLYSPTGAGIVSTYPWQLTAKGDYQNRNLVFAGQVQGYLTGAFVPGTPLLPEPIDGSLPANVNLSGAAG